MAIKINSRTEHSEQAALFDWIRRMEGQYPELKTAFAIPNGAALTWTIDDRGRRYSPQAAKLKAEGLRPGVPDLCLPVARNGYHACYIEMKLPGGVVSKEQREMIHALRDQDNNVDVCRSADEAIGCILRYLELESA